MKKFEEILKALPSNWAELKLKDFLALTQNVIEEKDEFEGLFVGVNNTINVISTLTGVPADEIEALPMHQMVALAKKIDFLSTQPADNGKSKIKWKKIDEVSYGNFIGFQMLSKDPVANLPSIIKAFSKEELTDEQVLNLDTETAYNSFFFLSKYVKKYTNSMMVSTSKKYMIQRLKETLFKQKSKV